MRNPDAMHIDYSSLLGVISENPKVLPSDLDLIYERKGHFLIAEFKRGKEKLSQGQKILLQNLAKLPQFKVIVVNGYSENKQLMIKSIYWIKPDGTYVKVGDGLDRFKQLINNWYASVNEQSRTSTQSNGGTAGLHGMSQDIPVHKC